MYASPDPLLGAVALLAAVAVAFSTFGVLQRVLRSTGRRAAYWHWGGAVSTGIGMWVTQFCTILAFDPWIPFRLAPLAILAGLCIGVLTAAIAVTLLVSERSVHHHMAGLVLGLGVCLLHVAGVQALQMEVAPEITRWKLWLGASFAVAASVVATRVVAALAHSQDAYAIWTRSLFAALFLGIALTGVLSLGASAYAYLPPSSMEVADGHLRRWLGSLAGLFSLFGTGLCLLALVFEEHITRARLRYIEAERKVRRLHDVMRVTNRVYRPGMSVEDVHTPSLPASPHAMEADAISGAGRRVDHNVAEASALWQGR
ncbi:MAG: hypothetical protein JJ896_16130 [Rhodothermales bacterium]|nr:hypothetical protein [Rhodothermales bacterium]MBO6781184.1 hypothetical protein [Rhodothermales bacterium]